VGSQLKRSVGAKVMPHKKRIMYIEKKAGGIVGPAKIGRVTYSKTGKTIYYKGRSFGALNGYGFKANFFDEDSLRLP
jgi:hypothetical protein